MEGQSREAADWGASREAEVAECKRKRGKRRMRRSVNAIKSEIWNLRHKRDRMQEEERQERNEKVCERHQIWNWTKKGKSRGKRGNRVSVKGRQWDPGMRRSVSSKSVISQDVHCSSFPLFIWISLSMGSLRTYFVHLQYVYLRVTNVIKKLGSVWNYRYLNEQNNHTYLNISCWYVVFILSW